MPSCATRCASTASGATTGCSGSSTASIREDTARSPGELNRPVGAVCRHGRGVTVLSGWAEHVEYAVALTAVDLISAAARLRKIRTDARVALSRVEVAAARLEESGSRGLARGRRSAVQLSRRLGELQLQLSFGVEAYLDGLHVPEIVLESYRASLAGPLAVASGAQTAGGMLERLASSLTSLRELLDAADGRLTAVRRRAWEIAAFYVTWVAVPIGLVFAFLASRTSQVSEARSLWDIRAYGWYYASGGGNTVRRRASESAATGIPSTMSSW